MFVGHLALRGARGFVRIGFSAFSEVSDRGGCWGRCCRVFREWSNRPECN